MIISCDYDQPINREHFLCGGPIVKHDICDSLNKHHLDVAVNQTIKLQKKLPNGEKAAHQLCKRVSAERTCSFAQVQGSNPGDNW